MKMIMQCPHILYIFFVDLRMNFFLTILFTTSSLLYGITISGYVEANGVPLSDVKVQLMHGSWKKIISKKVTDEDGFFDFTIRDKSLYKYFFLSFNRISNDSLVGPIKKSDYGKIISLGRLNIEPEYYEYAVNQRPDLFKPKDEFEKTFAYKKRKKLAAEYLKAVKKDYENIQLKKEREAEKHKKRIQEETKKINAEIIENSKKYTPVKIIKVGPYDADKEHFTSIEIEAKRKKVEPIEFGYVRTRDIQVANQLDGIKLIRPKKTYSNKKMRIFDKNEFMEFIGYMNEKKYVKSLEIFSKNGFKYHKINIKDRKLVRNRVIENISQIYVDVPIPLEEAKEVKTNYRSLEASGYTKYSADIQNYELYNVSFTDSSNGRTYKIGIWEDEYDTSYHEQEHRVKYGESLWTISKKYSVSIHDLCAVNKIKNRNTVKVGQKLIIPLQSGGHVSKKLIPPKLEMRVAFIEPNENGFLDAKETGEFKIELSNNGLGIAKNIKINLKEISLNEYLKYTPDIFIGDILPKQTKIKRIKISAKNKVKKEINTFIIKADELNGFSPNPTKITFETFPFIPPELTQVDFGIETADGTNTIKPSIGTSLQIRIQNQGKGEAKDVTFRFNTPKNLFLSPDSKTEYSFSSLKQGEFKDLDFEFFVNNKVSSNIKIFIDYTEESTKGQFELELDIKKPQQSINELVIRGKELQNTTIEDVATISVDVEKNIPETRRKSQYDLAIVFGIESYKDVPGVSFARRDAVWMKEYFQKTFNIPSNRIYTRTDADVGQAEFRKVFSKGGWIDKRIKKDKTNIFFYFAGHGAPNINDNKGYLIPYDGDPNYASQTGYSLEELYKEMNRFSSKSVTVFLDACFSGVNRNNEMLLANARPVFLEVDESYTDKVNVFSAAESKQISSSWPEKKHGLFSYFLMKGLKGDADFNKDKKLTFGELGRYLKENVSSTAGLLDREQTPSLSTQNENKTFIQY